MTVFTMLSHPVKWLSLALLLLTLSGCNSPFSDDSADLVDVWKPDPKCQLHQGSCSLKQDKQSISIALSPNHPIPIAHLLQAKVKLDNIRAQGVQIDIVGTNMYMGYNRTTLLPVPGQPGVYQGKIMLAFCTNQRMDWEISVLVSQKNNHIIKAPFLLTTHTR